MIILPNEVLLATLAVSQQCHQIALGPEAQQSRFFTGETRNLCCSALTLGSSPKTSSPTGALAIWLRMPAKAV